MLYFKIVYHFVNDKHSSSQHVQYSFHVASKFSCRITYIMEICAELLWQDEHHILTIITHPAGNLGVVAGSNDPWSCGLASPSMGSWINSLGVLPHFCGRRPLSRSSRRGSSCQAVDNLMRGVLCCARRHGKKLFFFFFFFTFSPWTLYSYNHPANHMNICISLNFVN